MINSSQGGSQVHSRRRAVNAEKDDVEVVPYSHEEIQKQFSTKINVNSAILVILFIVLLYFNANEIMEYIQHKAKHAEMVTTSHEESLKSLDHLEAQLHHATHTLKKVSGYEINPKIDWSGCLYEIPYPDTRKHIVPPPVGPITLVCCNTTVGVLNIEVHHAWAPLGAERFLDMVKSDFFSTRVGLFRALNKFLVQFGLAGEPAANVPYFKAGSLKDDPQWLPPGPPGREINGTRRYQKGYLSYAGAGPNSRGTQLIMAFENNLYLGGGSPWEVPWGQLFGDAAYTTLGKIYTGYGEKPSQGKIMNKGNKYLMEEFPKLDYITKCMITRENYHV